MADSSPQTLPGTDLLTEQGDLAAQMVAGIDAYLTQAIEASAAQRVRHWNRNCSSHERYIESIEPNRQRFARMIGLVDPREPIEMHEVVSIPPGGNGVTRSPYATGDGYTVFAVRWGVLQDVEAEGLLLLPDEEPMADIVAVPDCDWTPEMLAGLTSGIPEQAQFARRLAMSGCRVLIPTLIDRRDTYAGIPEAHMTNQPHREFVYRAAYEFGRYMVGYEVQKILAAVDWFASASETDMPIGVIGYGEGGLLALYAAAADTRIDTAVVSGYFEARERLYREPLYRNIFGLLTEFGDAEIASLIAPRALIIEACRHPEISGPPEPRDGRGGAAPGVITTPPLEYVKGEFERAQHLIEGLHPSAPQTLIINEDGNGQPGSDETLNTLMYALVGDRWQRTSSEMFPHPERESQGDGATQNGLLDADARQQCQFGQLVDHTQYLMREAEFRRAEFWSKADRSSVETWEASCVRYRDYCWDEIIGRLPEATCPINPRTRHIYETPAFTGYEVVLDVYDDVYAYGIILIPKDIPPGERRAVVVCQHGLEGRPQEVTNPDLDHEAYHRYACRLAERGYVTYAPQNPYIGQNGFRELLRKAHPLKQSLYGFIVRQHERTLTWLASLPFVDPTRLAFYGISYGGKTAMRIPALLEQYCLSICSADYNEWIWKNASTRHRYSYMISGEYDMPEYNLGNTFNYAELSWLICPRPFMVERGHDDGVAPDEWVAYEFARTRRHYVKLGIGDRTEMEVFDGPHTINGKGTFEFLDRHLR